MCSMDDILQLLQLMSAVAMDKQANGMFIYVDSMYDINLIIVLKYYELRGVCSIVYISPQFVINIFILPCIYVIVLVSVLLKCDIKQQDNSFCQNTKGLS